MKTKHLFLATALVASFASCTNEEIVEMQQGVVERPSVDNVKLNFVTDGVDSRLTFGSKGYAWEANDVIGALNMDQPLAKTGNWSAMYGFTSFINTSYPFTYNKEDGTWSTQGKMLEGNYFFAFPFTDYAGERYVKYTLDNQQQNGIKGAVVAENYAKNQVFIGYSPIMKGSEFDVLTDVEMTPLLGAIRLDIVNNGEKTYHINKIVLSGDTENYEVESVLTFDPKTADYLGYNVGEENAAATNGKTTFNYANYIGENIGKDNVYNIPEEDETYNRADALRKVANYGGDESNNFVQLFINGTESERAIAPKGTAYALVMVNPIEFCGKNATTGKYEGAAAGELELTIYTDEGIIESVSLLSASNEGVKTNGKVQATLPGVANTVKVTFDDTCLTESTSLEVYTEEDLYQLISWNAAAKVETPITATLKADVKLTKKAYELLAGNKNIELTINSATTTDVENEVYAEVLTLAADVPSAALENEGLIITSPVAVEGTIELGIKAQDLASITVLEEGVLNINVLNANVPAAVVVEEGATLNIGAAAKTSSTVKITNNGTMTVAAGALVQGLVENNGELNLNGTANNVANTKIVDLGASSKLMGGTNNGKKAIINTVSGATLKGISGTGEVKYVDGAIIVHITNTDGTKTSTVTSNVYVEVGNKDVAADTYKDKGVNLWKLTGDINVTADVELQKVQIVEGAVVELIVAEGKTLKLSDLTVVTGGAISSNGTIELKNIVVEEDAELTNNGTITVETSISNEGLIYNNGTVQSKSASDLYAANKLTGVVVKDLEATAANGENWKNNPFKNYDSTKDTLKKEAMKSAVTKWMEDAFAVHVDNELYYNGNPYDYVCFLNVVNFDNSDWKAVKASLMKNTMNTEDTADDVTLFTADELNPAKTKTNTVFATVVGELLTSAMQTTIKSNWIDTTTGSLTNGQFKQAAINAIGNKNTTISDDAAGVNKLVARILTKAYTATDAKTAAAIWDELTAIGTAITTTGVTATNSIPTLKYHFITKEDNIYKAVVAWATHSARITNGGDAWVESNGTSAGPKFIATDANNYNTVAALQAYVNYLNNLSTKTSAQQSAYDAIDEYMDYILALPASSFEAAQLNACWAHYNEAE